MGESPRTKMALPKESGLGRCTEPIQRGCPAAIPEMEGISPQPPISARLPLRELKSVAQRSNGPLHSTLIFCVS